jgi:antitoxin MazE
MVNVKKNVIPGNYPPHRKKNGSSHTAFDKITSVAGRIRRIGNSKGILLSNSILKESGIAENTVVTVTTEKGKIIIMPAENKRKINTDLSTWEAQFKAAIKSGNQPEKDLFEGMENKFDKEEW